MIKSKEEKRKRRIIRVRKKISGTNEVPRVCISKTNKHLYAQVIDDVSGRTLFGCSTYSDAFKKINSNKAGSSNVDNASLMAEIVAEYIKLNNIKSAKFDKRWMKYHGIVAKFADKIRENVQVF